MQTLNTNSHFSQKENQIRIRMTENKQHMRIKNANMYINVTPELKDMKQLYCLIHEISVIFIHVFPCDVWEINSCCC